ncbi:RPPK2B [Auxenochlorella protothecoides x Auxenochlorella symbiontica]
MSPSFGHALVTNPGVTCTSPPRAFDTGPAQWCSRILSRSTLRRSSLSSQSVALGLDTGESVGPSARGFRVTAPNIDVKRIPDDQLRRDSFLFYHPECETLAREVAEVSNGNVQLGRITWKRFQDGFPKLLVDDAERIRNRHVSFLATFHDPGVIFEQLSIIYHLPRLFVASFTLVLPFFSTGTAERVEVEGDVATAYTLARMISNIPLARGGPASVVIFDIHALQERFYFGDGVLPLFESGIPLLRRRLVQLPDHDNITIAYPDEGAWKRFHFQLADYPEVVCTKVRDGDARMVQLKEGSPQGRHVVIVDDLVQSGGTLLECQRLLASQGALAVSAYATHGVFPKGTWSRFLPGSQEGSPGFRYVWITDSCPDTVTAVQDREPFEILSLARPIAAALQV